MFTFEKVRFDLSKLIINVNLFIYFIFLIIMRCKIVKTQKLMYQNFVKSTKSKKKKKKKKLWFYIIVLIGR